ncbi:hypothetical protein BESB_045600 [Besnoitia besnoiti]|uniref:Uncharacterized protein n=1 Tax=Besnoitia besnoiti TaxID=94643 RepID=A0A2A9MD06_BESBE|nr:hypothetical protein BESB_045600 [Besnoitia besnoiti]PFH36368.1 hypothetical protein BESB_045600 [Besnoitia besnoiti]
MQQGSLPAGPTVRARVASAGGSRPCDAEAFVPVDLVPKRRETRCVLEAERRDSLAGFAPPSPLPGQLPCLLTTRARSFAVAAAATELGKAADTQAYAAAELPEASAPSCAHLRKNQRTPMRGLDPAGDSRAGESAKSPETRGAPKQTADPQPAPGAGPLSAARLVGKRRGDAGHAETLPQSLEWSASEGVCGASPGSLVPRATAEDQHSEERAAAATPGSRRSELKPEDEEGDANSKQPPRGGSRDARLALPRGCSPSAKHEARAARESSRGPVSAEQSKEVRDASGEAAASLLPLRAARRKASAATPIPPSAHPSSVSTARRSSSFCSPSSAGSSPASVESGSRRDEEALGARGCAELSPGAAAGEDEGVEWDAEQKRWVFHFFRGGQPAKKSFAAEKYGFSTARRLAIMAKQMNRSERKPAAESHVDPSPSAATPPDSAASSSSFPASAASASSSSPPSTTSSLASCPRRPNEEAAASPAPPGLPSAAEEGIEWDGEQRRWIFRFLRDGEPAKKSFAVEKYGFSTARRLAIMAKHMHTKDRVSPKTARESPCSSPAAPLSPSGARASSSPAGNTDLCPSQKTTHSAATRRTAEEPSASSASSFSSPASGSPARESDAAAGVGGAASAAAKRVSGAQLAVGDEEGRDGQGPEDEAATRGLGEELHSPALVAQVSVKRGRGRPPKKKKPMASRVARGVGARAVAGEVASPSLTACAQQAAARGKAAEGSGAGLRRSLRVESRAAAALLAERQEDGDAPRDRRGKAAREKRHEEEEDSRDEENGEETNAEGSAAGGEDGESRKRERESCEGEDEVESRAEAGSVYETRQKRRARCVDGDAEQGRGQQGFAKGAGSSRRARRAAGAAKSSPANAEVMQPAPAMNSGEQTERQEVVARADSENRGSLAASPQASASIPPPPPSLSLPPSCVLKSEALASSSRSFSAASSPQLLPASDLSLAGDLPHLTASVASSPFQQLPCPSLLASTPASAAPSPGPGAFVSSLSPLCSPPSFAAGATLKRQSVCRGGCRGSGSDAGSIGETVLKRREKREEEEDLEDDLLQAHAFESTQERIERLRVCLEELRKQHQLFRLEQGLRYLQKRKRENEIPLSAYLLQGSKDLLARYRDACASRAFPLSPRASRARGIHESAPEDGALRRTACLAEAQNRVCADPEERSVSCEETGDGNSRGSASRETERRQGEESGDGLLVAVAADTRAGPAEAQIPCLSVSTLQVIAAVLSDFMRICSSRDRMAALGLSEAEIQFCQDSLPVLRDALNYLCRIRSTKGPALLTFASLFREVLLLLPRSASAPREVFAHLTQLVRRLRLWRSAVCDSQARAAAFRERVVDERTWLRSRATDETASAMQADSLRRAKRAVGGESPPPPASASEEGARSDLGERRRDESGEPEEREVETSLERALVGCCAPGLPAISAASGASSAAPPCSTRKRARKDVESLLRQLLSKKVAGTDGARPSASRTGAAARTAGIASLLAALRQTQEGSVVLGEGEGDPERPLTAMALRRALQGFLATTAPQLLQRVQDVQDAERAEGGDAETDALPAAKRDTTSSREDDLESADPTRVPARLDSSDRDEAHSESLERRLAALAGKVKLATWPRPPIRGDGERRADADGERPASASEDLIAEQEDRRLDTAANTTSRSFPTWRGALLHALQSAKNLEDLRKSDSLQHLVSLWGRHAALKGQANASSDSPWLPASPGSSASSWSG